MKTVKVPFRETNQFGKFFLDYVDGNEKLQPYFDQPPAVEAFEKVIGERNFSLEQRKELVDVLTSQYENFDVPEGVQENVERIGNERTFTVTTGHQLNIFTGPLYFIYKIVSTINACKKLKEAYPDFHFVPVYWMATEDHDFDEINHFYFQGEKHEWKTDQKGAVGRFDPAGLKEICEKLPEAAAFFSRAYEEKTLASAVRHYVNHLFGKEGLVVLDADDVRLKNRLAPVIREELTLNTSYHLVAEASGELSEAGYKPQVAGREINFFYMDGDIRERIVQENGKFSVLNTDLVFEKEELLNMADSHPDRFSPNVILRPLYQEMILPNLAYAGGPSELVYWLQLRKVFEHYQVPFPVLLARNFATIVEEPVWEKWSKTGLSVQDPFPVIGAGSQFVGKQAL